MKILAISFLTAVSIAVGKPLTIEEKSFEKVLQYCKDKDFLKGEAFPVEIKGLAKRHVFSTGPKMLSSSSSERIIILDIIVDNSKSNEREKWYRFYFTITVDDKLYVKLQTSEGLASTLLQQGRRITQYLVLTRNDELPTGYELISCFRRKSDLLWKDGKQGKGEASP